MHMPNLKEARKRTNQEVITKNYESNLAYQELLKDKAFYLKTYGCQMNEHDSENMIAILKSVGMKQVENFEDADLIMLNTCSIRENAHNKVFGMLGRIKHLKQTKKDIVVGITGCMAQEEVVAEEILNKYKWMDFVLGTHNIHNLSQIVYESFKEKNLKIEAPSIEGDIIENIPVERQSKYKAYVNIMYGCDKFCTYCIVPYTRGKQRSRSKDDILKEVTDLINEGYQEVTLLGQNVNAYGKDIDDLSFAQLLEQIALIGIERIRFTTSHPYDFSDELIDVIAKYPNIMNHIHLPVQSGDDNILKLMGRRYNREKYLNLVNKIRSKIKNVALTTDIIVGFPNESLENFQNTLSLVSEVKYDGAFTFIYSPREGTPAAKMKDNVSMATKKERFNELTKLISKYQADIYKNYENKIVKVLVDGESKKNSQILSGYTEDMKLVNFVGCKNLIGKIVNVKINKAKTYTLEGEVID